MLQTHRSQVRQTQSNTTLIVLFGAWLVSTCCIASQALGHVGVSPSEAPLGSYAKLTFRVPHGCEGAATTRVRIQIPAGILSVKPQMHPTWKIEIKKENLPTAATDAHGKKITQVVREVSFSGGPLPDDFLEEFGMQVRLPDSSDASFLAFPVVQECEKGLLTRWIQVPVAGQDKKQAGKLEHPAPLLKLVPTGAAH